MAQWGNTTFTEFIGDQQGPNEQYMAEGARVTRQLDVIPGTVAAREQAIADFLGYNVVKAGPNGGKYISRATPMPYTYAQTQPSLLPSKQYLYAANIVRGMGIGPTGTTLSAVPGPLPDKDAQGNLRPPPQTIAVGGVVVLCVA